MPASTLALGSSYYELLDQVSVSQSGKSTLIRNTNADGIAPIEGLGIAGTSGIENVSLRGNVEDLFVNLGGSRDTLNVLGDIENAQILLDEELNGAEVSGQGNDLLNISGSLTSSQGSTNSIWAGGGNDTIRIAGLVENTQIHLGSGDDSLVIGDNASDVYVAGAGGLDYIEFRGMATDVIVNLGDDSDTVVFRQEFAGDSFDDDIFATAAVELGGGNDSLILSSGARNAEINTGSGNDTVRLTGTFDSASFHLDGTLESNLIGGDLITASSGTQFYNTSFTSFNLNGDTLLVGTGAGFLDSEIFFGSGDDSISFGSGSSIFDATFSLGGGADTLVFGSGSILGNVLIELGDDYDIDLVRFSDTVSLDGVTIRGAGTGDILYIGADQYFYGNSGSDTMLVGYEGVTNWYQRA